MRFLVLALLSPLSLFGTQGLPQLPDNCASTLSIGAHHSPAPATADGEFPAGHAHNDYEHDRPLVAALEAGFTSIEVDVWALDGRLLVAHDRSEVTAERTLEDLYLRPLADRYADGEPAEGGVQLLVDVKDDPEGTVPLLAEVLSKYAPILTSYRGCVVSPGPVSVVLSGAAEPVSPRPGVVSWFGYDFQPGRDGGGVPAAVTPLVSVSWAGWFTWDGNGPMPVGEKARLTELIAAAHAAGSRVRLWNTPDRAGVARDAVWAVLAATGVDYINTDDLDVYTDYSG